VTLHGRSQVRLVLVVDDSEPVRTLVARILRSAGYQVDVASSVATATALAEAHSYHVAVVDVNLAGGERGYDLVLALRQRHDELATHCLFLTGGTTDGLPAGAAVLVKPFLAEDLVEAVGRLIPAAADAAPESDADAAPDSGIPAPGAPESGAPGSGESNAGAPVSDSPVSDSPVSDAP
jgi:DNA-binding response OmpR family regulator